jgi:tripartite-type tricarboxylate transporter receptor subunit TctC
MRRRHLLAAPLLAAPLLAAPVFAKPLRAQERYPSRPVRLIIPVAVAGATDIVGRIVADAMAPLLGQPIVVENMDGAGSTVGAAAFQRLPADGHALYIGTNNHALMNAMYPRFAFNAVDDFIPIALVSRQPFVLTVNPALPVQNVADLLAWLRVRRAAANYGATTPGANNHMAGELLRQLAGVEFTTISYRSAPLSVQDVVAGRLDFTIDSPTMIAPLIRDSLLRGLAVSTAEPSALLPALPSLNQAGVPGFDMAAWSILFARAGTPPAIVATLREAAARALALPVVRQRLAGATFELWPDNSPEAATALLRREIDRWAPIAAAAIRSPS